MFDITSYKEALSITHAVELLAANPAAKLIAGGTDLLLHIREGKLPDAHLISIHDLEELKGVFLQADGTIVIKPATTFSQLAEHPLIMKYLPFLSDAVQTVGGPQTRHAGTIGGNICNGATSADSAPMLFALNAHLYIQGQSGERLVSICDFYEGPGKVRLGQTEIVTAIAITPENYRYFTGHYVKYAMRNAMDIATLSCAIMCRVNNDILEDFRLALGVAAPTPIRCRETEHCVIGQPVNKELMKKLERSVLTEVNPRTSWRSSREYRLQLVKELCTRTLSTALAKAGKELA